MDYESELEPYLHLKLCVFDRRAHLLWRSSAWSGSAWNYDPHLAGLEWLEFVATDDRARVVRFLGDGRRTSISFVAMQPSSGVIARIVWAKVPLGRHVLVVGAVCALASSEPARSYAAKNTPDGV